MHPIFRKNTSLLFGICLLFAFSSCKKQKEAVIVGTIENLQQTDIISSYFKGDSLHIDTIVADKKGQFKTRIPMDTLTAITLYFNNNASSLVIFADTHQKIKLNGDANIPDLIEVKGSRLNEDITNFKKENALLLQQRDDLLDDLSDKSSKQNAISDNKYMAKVKSINNELMLKTEDFVKKNPGNLASVILINDFFKIPENTAALKRVLGYLSGDVQTFPLTKSLKSYSDKLQLSAEGSPMPHFELKQGDTKQIRSGDYRNKYLLLSFVSASGEESRNNLQLLKQAYASVKSDSVAFLTVYIDSENYPVKTLKTDSLPWKSVSETKSWASPIVNAYNVPYIPYNVLISPKGTILHRDILPQDVKNTILK